MSDEKTRNEQKREWAFESFESAVTTEFVTLLRVCKHLGVTAEEFDAKMHDVFEQLHRVVDKEKLP